MLNLIWFGSQKYNLKIFYDFNLSLNIYSLNFLIKLNINLMILNLLL